MSGARTRRWRERQKAGRIVLAVEADEIALIDKLVATSFLRPEFSDDPVAIKRALEKLIDRIVVTDVETL